MLDGVSGAVEEAAARTAYSLGNYRLGFCLFPSLFVSHDIKAGFWICFLYFGTTFAVSLNSKSLKPKGTGKHQKLEVDCKLREDFGK